MRELFGIAGMDLFLVASNNKVECDLVIPDVTAVFFIKYLQSMGFNVTNDVFAKNAWYFRNSLVRANYRDVKNGIYEDMSFLETFLRNLLMGENNELKNRYMHIRWEETTHSDGKQHIKQHIKHVLKITEKPASTLLGKICSEIRIHFYLF